MNQLNPYIRLTRLDKPIGIYLLLWPTLWALVAAAQGIPDWKLLVIFSLGVVIMRSAGCVINDFADRKVDGHVKRTNARPLVDGSLTAKQALNAFALLIVCAFVLVLFLNRQTILLSFVAVFLATLYPFMKRYTHLPQLFLGAAFSWAIPMAFMATLQHIPTVAWWLFAANLFWTMAYDTLYAMVDRDDDLKIGVKSTAILFGRFDKAMVFLLQLAMLACCFYAGIILSLQPIYFTTLGLSLGLFIAHQLSIKQRTRAACFTAFKQNHYAGLLILFGLMASYTV
ncbi:4-hydroxybenzoate octaprenyltransferase [Catenovulum agarivorans DS-2]|uniref:4-hydroxybenzoate octaprenyltransferase n=1 Tax=Catenovulum agarivorans DS-2 TaxID=1328313 RepID=W7QXM6_9ALTE|nr:4-hydroxybenzoate octaprenyltransferase [Catenovulum agarivorans]EWH10040.1 4-hydroxybenzoate octaprenyltransferase [Catenovulum agarivorans DS-2]